jgi:hypothetical protein
MAVPIAFGEVRVNHRLAAAWLVVLAGFALAGCSSNAVPSSPTAVSTTAVSSGPVVTLVSVTESINVTTGATGTWNHAGQSVTIPGTGTFSSVRFSFYTFRGTPTAFGTLFVLDREYLGLPGDLGPSTPGYLGQAAAVVEGNPGPMDDVKGEYVFPTSVALKGGGKYWFYTNAMGSFCASFDTDIYAGGDMYVSGYYAVPFRKAPASGRMTGPTTYVPPPPGVYVDANFRLQAVATQ